MCYNTHMKKKELLIFTICFVITVFISCLVVFVEKKDDISNYEILDANKTCFYESVTKDEDGLTIGSNYNYMYIYTKDNYVSKVIYRNIFSRKEFGDSLSDTLIKMLNIYEGTKGITTSYEDINDKVMLTITFDLSSMNIDEIREEYSEIFDDTSILMNLKNKMTIEDYLKIETNEYICE